MFDITDAFRSAKEIAYAIIIIGLVCLAFYSVLSFLFRARGEFSSFEVLERRKPMEPYREIGKIIVEDLGRDQDMMKMLIKEAKRRGADGIILISPPEKNYEIRLEAMAFKYI